MQIKHKFNFNCIFTFKLLCTYVLCIHSFTNVLGKAMTRNCVNITVIHRRIQDCFPPGTVKLVTKVGVQGAEPPGGGCKGVEPLCVGNFGISELNLRNLVHTFDNSMLSILLFIFFYHVKPMNMMKMGHFNLSFIVSLNPLTNFFF